MLRVMQVLSLLLMALVMVVSKPRTAKLLRQGKMMEVPGGLDFDGAELDLELGQMCIMREDLVQTVERQPRLHCDVKYGLNHHYRSISNRV